MSLASWKAEFYPIPANTIIPELAVAHSLKKWIGLRPENLKKHGVSLDVLDLEDEHDTLRIDSSSCALCTHYIQEGCRDCPLAKLLGNRCDNFGGSPFTKFIRGDPEPMIQALEKL